MDECLLISGTVPTHFRHIQAKLRANAVLAFQVIFMMPQMVINKA